jgi:hypothetical protein
MPKTFLIVFAILLVLAVITYIAWSTLKLLWHLAWPVFILAIIVTAVIYGYKRYKSKNTGA